MLFKIFIIFLLVGLNGFFVAAEFALVKLRRGELKIMATRHPKAAGFTEIILNHLDGYLSACQLGITLASLGLGWVGEPLVARMLTPLFHYLQISEDKVHLFALPLAFFLITFLHITLGEQVPKIYAIYKPRGTAIAISFPLWLFYKVFAPFIWVLNESSNFMLRAVGIDLESGHSHTHSEEEIRSILIDSVSKGHVSDREHAIIEKALDLEVKIARRYMIPRDQIIYLNTQESIADSLKKASQSGHSRFPICEGDLDRKVLGFLHVKDIFKFRSEGNEIQSLTDFTREILILPEKITLEGLLNAFQKKRIHLALLIDDYSVVSGMITLENVLEQLVGQIQDEFDSEEPTIIQQGNGSYELDAACQIEDINQACGVKIPDRESDTIGGFLSGVLEHIPKKGELYESDTFQLTVLETDSHRIKKILLEKNKTSN